MYIIADDPLTYYSSFIVINSFILLYYAFKLWNIFQSNLKERSLCTQSDKEIALRKSWLISLLITVDVLIIISYYIYSKRILDLIILFAFILLAFLYSPFLWFFDRLFLTLAFNNYDKIQFCIRLYARLLISMIFFRLFFSFSVIIIRYFFFNYYYLIFDGVIFVVEGFYIGSLLNNYSLMGNEQNLLEYTNNSISSDTNTFSYIRLTARRLSDVNFKEDGCLDTQRDTCGTRTHDEDANRVKENKNEKENRNG